MTSVETIAAEGVVLCHIVRSDQIPEVTTFSTPPEAVLQVGHIVYPRGHEIPRHEHRPVERQITGTGEVLLVRSGRCELDVYDGQRRLVTTRELLVGDIVIMAGGGHGLRMVEDTVLLEVKQGPYAGADEKVRF